MPFKERVFFAVCMKNTVSSQRTSNSYHGGFTIVGTRALIGRLRDAAWANARHLIIEQLPPDEPGEGNGKSDPSVFRFAPFVLARWRLTLSTSAGLWARQALSYTRLSPMSLCPACLFTLLHQKTKFTAFGDGKTFHVFENANMRRVNQRRENPMIADSAASRSLLSWMTTAINRVTMRYSNQNNWWFNLEGVESFIAQRQIGARASCPLCCAPYTLCYCATLTMVAWEPVRNNYDLHWIISSAPVRILVIGLTTAMVKAEHLWRDVFLIGGCLYSHE